MLVRSLIVLLVVLNLGVAAWWLLHDAPAPTPLLQPAGVPRLQLRDEAPPARIVQPARRTAAPVQPAETTACTGAEADAGGWRVFLPPLASVEDAEALAARIGESGFSDYLVIREGAEMNSVALGRYGTREAAQRRIAALQAAGFPARCARIPATSQESIRPA